MSGLLQMFCTTFLALVLVGSSSMQFKHENHHKLTTDYKVGWVLLEMSLGEEEQQVVKPTKIKYINNFF